MPPRIRLRSAGCRCLAHQLKLVNPVKAGQAVRWADVAYDAGAEAVGCGAKWSRYSSPPNSAQPRELAPVPEMQRSDISQFPAKYSVLGLDPREGAWDTVVEPRPRGQAGSRPLKARQGNSYENHRRRLDRLRWVHDSIEQARAAQILVIDDQSTGRIVLSRS